jgi:poly-gamma-glutamate capsule biosynthesis protein CapA/YwtB (metallophosphatase superfamily)
VKFEPFRIALTGDSMITRRIADTREQPVRQAIEQVRAADVAFTNLEVLPTDFRGTPAQESGGDHMAAHSWVIDELVEMGFDLFAAAHNHTLDYSIDGVLATIENLERRNVSYAGIGRNLGEARMPVYHDTPAGSVALISCSSTFRPGQQAGAQRPDMPGRPGLNPLRFTTTYEITERQMTAVREIAEDLGLERQRQERLQIGFSFPPDDEAVFPLGDLQFRIGERHAIRRKLNEGDVSEIAAWVRDARRRADYVIVSLHAHEQGDSKEEPADFIPVFCRQMVDEGADIVVGHGPHLLRGMEIYNSKPIFYSLGNFIDQHDLIYKMPADAYEKFRIDPEVTPAELVRIRGKDDTISFGADERYWQTVVPTCTFEGGSLREISLLPVALGYGRPVHERGKPGLAEPEEAAKILGRFARVSEPFGTRIAVSGERAIVELDAPE